MKVAYRETITANAEAEGKYKKQTGGHGQFGVAFVRVEPLERGAGFEFVDKIVGGAIPRQFIPAVEKGVARDDGARRRASASRSSTCRSRCFDGKYHSVDSSEMSFKMAGSLGFKEAMAKAGPILLEPISELVVIAPEASQGDIMGDLNSKRGRIQGSSAVGNGEVEIVALGADVGGAALRDRPALDDRRPRPLRGRRTRTTTRCRRTSSTRSRRSPSPPGPDPRRLAAATATHALSWRAPRPS